MATYTVNYWGSNPDAGNDDCWTGQDFDTRADAEACYHASFDGLPGCPKQDVHTIELDGPDVHLERRNLSFRKTRDDNSDWQREQAMQAGMAGGCDWYNDAMGY